MEELTDRTLPHVTLVEGENLSALTNTVVEGIRETNGVVDTNTSIVVE